MMTLVLVFRASMLNEVEELMKKNGIGAYSLLHKLEGKGETGNVMWSFLYPGSNSVIFTVLSAERARQVVDALQTFRASRVQAAEGKAIPFKLFAFPCEELI